MNLFLCTKVINTIPTQRKVRILWFSRSGDTYHPLPEKEEHIRDIPEQTVLLSGFQLTQQGKLYNDFSDALLKELKNYN